MPTLQLHIIQWLRTQKEDTQTYPENNGMQFFVFELNSDGGPDNQTKTIRNRSRSTKKGEIRTRWRETYSEKKHGIRKSASHYEQNCRNSSQEGPLSFQGLLEIERDAVGGERGEFLMGVLKYTKLRLGLRNCV